MGNAVQHRDRLIVVAPRLAGHEASLSDRLRAIAELGVGMLAAESCAVAFQSSAGIDEVVYAPRSDLPSVKLVNAILAALGNRLIDARRKNRRNLPDPIESFETSALRPRELDAIARSEGIDDERVPAGAAFTNASGAVRIAVIARAGRAAGELEASLELMAAAVFGEVASRGARASLDFWRMHGAESGRQAEGAKRELTRERQATDHLDEAAAAVRKAQPAERCARLGELVARGAGFDQWIVAVADGGSLVVAASSFAQEQFDLAATGSALEESFRRRILIARWRDGDVGALARNKQYSEDKIFGGSYVCLPFEAGAIALGAGRADASAAKAEALVERLAPFIAGWVMERYAARQSLLMRRLGLRLFTAVDEERARIARDLHDDQAQLLTAVKIALEGRRKAARAILQQVEQELRRKTRELRPATLGNASLDQAIEHEFARLNRAGIRATLTDSDAGERISRPIQQLCLQVVREALSNVIRHARAKSAQIEIKRTDAIARVSVIDDGCGIDAGAGEGIGMAGMRERLELMGGRLIVESRAGGTTVVAEIPESA